MFTRVSAAMLVSGATLVCDSAVLVMQVAIESIQFVIDTTLTFRMVVAIPELGAHIFLPLVV